MALLARRPRVLVVDDLEPLAEAVAGTLADAGYEVAVALDCRSARLARFGPPGVDLLLTDVRLTDGSGLALAAEMLALGRPSVVMSGDVSALDRAAAYHPWTATLAKPFRGADLVRSVDRVLCAWPPAWMLFDAQPLPAAGARALMPDENGGARSMNHDPDRLARGCGFRAARQRAGSHPGHGPRHDGRR